MGVGGFAVAFAASVGRAELELELELESVQFARLLKDSLHGCHLDFGPSTRCAGHLGSLDLAWFCDCGQYAGVAGHTVVPALS